MYIGSYTYVALIHMWVFIHTDETETVKPIESEMHAYSYIAR